MTLTDFLAYVGVGVIVSVVVAIILFGLERTPVSLRPFRMVAIAAMILFGIFTIGFAVGTWLGI